VTPNFFEIGLCAVLAAFGAVSVLASAVVFALWPLVRTRLAGFAPGNRALCLFALRLLPTALALAASLSVALPMFLEFEAPDTLEAPGGALEAMAAVGAGLGAVGAVRFFLALLRTRRILSAWRRTGRAATVAGARFPALRVSSRLPVVALAGWRRPVLFVADGVFTSCEPGLLEAMAAHEAGHWRVLDNAKHLMLAACGDLLTWSRTGRALLEEWEAAAEEAADDQALAAGTTPGDLAEAILAVVRLSPAERWPEPAAAWLYRGGCFERRVRRLLDGAAAPPASRSRWPSALAIAALLIGWGFAAEALHRPAHRLLERAVAGHRGEIRALVVVPPRH
jgi:hypothetical protein